MLSVVWIYAIANEIVNLLQVRHYSYLASISQSIFITVKVFLVSRICRLFPKIKNLESSVFINQTYKNGNASLIFASYKCLKTTCIVLFIVCRFLALS